MSRYAKMVKTFESNGLRSSNLNRTQQKQKKQKK